MKKAIVSVINDLVTDQRVNRNCLALEKEGYQVLLVGRKKKDSLALNNRSYQIHRMRLIFEKGPLFYAEFNIRLFFYLLVHSADLHFANDLDTILPNLIISKLNGSKFIFDSHEYFTETPELVNRPIIQKVWKTIEKYCIPQINNLITVNDSIANLFKKEYNKDFTVVRNIATRVEVPILKSKSYLGLPENRKIILLQGAGINIDRGTEELVEAMQYVNNDYLLLIIGDGDVIDTLVKMSIDLKLEDQIRFIPKLSFEDLYQYTRHADLGLSIDKDTNINYRFSLPNKIFDYIHAGIPVLCSRLVEIEKIITQYKIGDFIDSHQPGHIAAKINDLIENEERLSSWKKNTIIAASELNWVEEEKKLLRLIENAR